MGASSPPLTTPSSNLEFGYETRRHIVAGLTVIFSLIVLAIVVGVVASILSWQWPTGPVLWSSWSWLPTLIIVLLTLFIAVWVLRVIFWGLGMAPYRRYYARHGSRYGYARRPFGGDSAVLIARERFARGEISKEQLDQIVRQLGEGSDSYPPVW
jgi:uncharacterized membrane protein